MADLNALIAQGVQFKAPQDPFAQYAQMQQLQQGRQANQLNQMKMQEYQRGVAETNALRQLDPSSPEYLKDVMRISPEKGYAYGKLQQESETAKLTQSKTKADLAKSKKEFVQQAQRDTSRNPSDANVTAFKEDLMASDLFTDAEKAQMAAGADRILAMPLGERQAFMASQGATAGELKPTLTPQTLGGTTQVLSTPAFGGTASVVPGSTGTVTNTPFQTGELGISTERNRIAAGQLKVAQDRLAKDNVLLDPAETAAISKAIIAGRVDPTKVNGRNAKIIASTLLADPNVNIKELGIEAAGAGAGARALGTQSAKILTAANEADQMVKVVRDYSTKIDRTEYPTINAISNAVSKGTGGKEVVQLNTAINALVNSYARAINPTGVATVSDKTHARDIINSNYANGQLNAILDVMSQEMEIAKASPGESAKQLKAGRTGGTPIPAATKGGATVSNW